jgi:uncharacterized membrane protein
MEQSPHTSHTRSLVVASLLAALVFVVTWTIRIPVPSSAGGGYVNIGDTVINAGALLVGGPLAALAAGIGSGLADLAAGAAVYIVPTIVIKAVMAAIVALFARRQNFWFYAAGVLIAELVMLGGYFVFEYFAFDVTYASSAVLFNLGQAAVNLLVSCALYRAVLHLKGIITR